MKHLISGLLSAEDDEDDAEDDSDVKQNNTKQLSQDSGPSSADKTQLSLPLHPQSQQDPHHHHHQPRAKLIRQTYVDHGRECPPSYEEQDRSKSSFASSEYFSMSLKSSSLQVDDIKY